MSKPKQPKRRVKSTVRHLTARTNADGSVRHYWQPSTTLRAGGFAVVRLDDDRAIAVGEAEALNRKADAWRKNRGQTNAGPGKGTVSALIAAYQRSRFWTKLAPKTRLEYGKHLRTVETWAGDVPVVAIRKPALEALYSAHLATGRHAMANALMRTIQAVWKAGEALGYVDSDRNPARRMGLQQTAKAPTIWSREAVAAIVAAADAAGRHSIGTAVILNEWCGQRPADLLAAADHAIVDGELRITQAKRGARVALPIGIVPHLAARLEAERTRQSARGRIGPCLIIDEANGRPYSVDSFSRAIAESRERAAASALADGRADLARELSRCTFRHLRHTAVTRLADAGVGEIGIAAITGHSLQAIKTILDHYLVRTAEQARNAFQRRIAAEQGELL